MSKIIHWTIFTYLKKYRYQNNNRISFVDFHKIFHDEYENSDHLNGDRSKESYIYSLGLYTDPTLSDNLHNENIQEQYALIAQKLYPSLKTKTIEMQQNDLEFIMDFIKHYNKGNKRAQSVYEFLMKKYNMSYKAVDNRISRIKRKIEKDKNGIYYQKKLDFLK